MKQLLPELIILTLLIGITYAVATTYVDTNFSHKNSYMAMSLVKEQKLHETRAPRLLLLGGSNVLFGFDSQLLQQQKQAKVINMGLHAGVGLTFVLNESINQISTNDTVILCPEYYVTDDGINAQVDLITINPKAQKYLDYNLFDLIRVYFIRLQKTISIPFSYLGNTPEVPKTYTTENLNEFGDINHYYPEDKKPINMKELLPQMDYTRYIAKINKFIRDSNKKGATVYFTFPPLCASEYQLNKASITALEIQYKQQLHCNFLGTATDFVYPDDCFFDTIYHLNATTRIIRTKKIIELLNKA